MDTLSPPGDNPEPWRIAYGHLKGGVVKSTSTWFTAYEIARRTGERVLVVDADPLSQTLADSYRAAVALGVEVPFELVEWRTPDGFVEGIRAEMKRRNCRHLVVDVGGEHETLLERACMVVDELIVPCPPNDPDVRRVPATLSVAARIDPLSPVNVSILLTKVSTNPRVKDAENKRDWMRAPGRDWPVLETMIPEGVFYRRALEDFPEDSSGKYADLLDELIEIRQSETVEEVAR